MKRTDFLELLFDPGQYSCYTRNPKGVKVKKYPNSKDLYFSINALSPTEDLQPTKKWHSPHKPRRADINVTCFRNFLIELDDMELADQIRYVRSLVPISAITFSGKKSYHFIISLEEALPDYNSYMEVSNKLQKLIARADSQCKNPSRLSRLPGSIRPDTTLEQKLVFLGARIPNEELYRYLPNTDKQYKVINTIWSEEQPSKYKPVQIVRAISTPQDQIDKLGGRNAYFFWLGCRLREMDTMNNRKIKNMVELAYERLPDTSGFSLREAFDAARVTK